METITYIFVYCFSLNFWNQPVNHITPQTKKKPCKKLPTSPLNRSFPRPASGKDGLRSGRCMFCVSWMACSKLRECVLCQVRAVEVLGGMIRLMAGWNPGEPTHQVEVGSFYSLSHYLRGFSTISGGCLGILNHQQYHFCFWTDVWISWFFVGAVAKLKDSFWQKGDGQFELWYWTRCFKDLASTST